MSKRARRTSTIWATVIIALLAFGAGYFARGRLLPAAPAPAGGKPVGVSDSEEAAQLWYCAMDPQFVRSAPGKCGICGMDLVPMPQELTPGARILETSPAAKALMDIETSPVERRFVEVQVRLVGKVDYDETRLSDIAAWVSGRLERLFVDYTGLRVNKGDHMVELYSPELLAGQEELLQAIQAVKDLERSDVAVIRETAAATVSAAREKLRLLGLATEQIAELEKRNRASDHVTIYAPSSGIVIDKHLQEGAYVKTGSRIYTLADLSQVWVRLDAYESDLSWLRYGQTVEFTTIAYPGETFSGTISFIDPVLNPTTRTVKVRVNAANPDGRLRPGMFVKAVAQAKVASDGRVMDTRMAGKWICPMHPSEVKETSGKCGICGMELVPAESLGYVTDASDEHDKPLVIPVSAALVTGMRAVAYVELPGTAKPTFEGREIALGPRAGDYYLVRSGLAEGERVVTRGNFKIDSALQIQAKPSMMSPEGGRTAGTHRHDVEAPVMPQHETIPPVTPPAGEPVSEKPLVEKPTAGAIVNARCPIMGNAIDPANVPPELIRMFRGQKVGFCCAGCPPEWDRLSEEEKEAKLKAAMGDEHGGRQHE